jgi:hypothetical protein
MMSDENSELVEQTTDISWADKARTVVKSGFKGALGTVPGGSIFVEALNAVDEVGTKRQIHTLELAVEALKTDLTSLGKQLTDHIELAELYKRVMVEAKNAKTENKIVALAGILTQATNESLQLNLANIYIHIIELLEDDHIKLLEAIDSLEDQAPVPEIEGIIGNTPGASIRDLERSLTSVQPVIKILINNLISLELIREVMMNVLVQGAVPSGRYALTELGDGLIQYLHQLNRD